MSRRISRGAFKYLKQITAPLAREERIAREKRELHEDGVQWVKTIERRAAYQHAPHPLQQAVDHYRQQMKVVVKTHAASSGSAIFVSGTALREQKAATTKRKLEE